MAKRKSHRARRAHRDWAKDDRRREGRLEGRGKRDEDLDEVRSGRSRMKPRHVSIEHDIDPTRFERGQVVKAQSGEYVVQLDSNDRRISCRVKRGASSDNSDSTFVTIGDSVRIQELESNAGLIMHVEKRASRVMRSGTGRQRGAAHVIAANLDQLLCVVSADPEAFRKTIIDRYVVGALLGSVSPVIVVNKIDLLDNELRQVLDDECSVYRSIGYPVIMTSAVNGEGLDELSKQCKNRTSALVGKSGTGKSSLVNALLGSEERRVAEVRESDKRGRHTTTGSVILSLPSGGKIIDTPGLREFGIWNVEKEELDGYFEDFHDVLDDCKFQPCSHTHEPECAVQKAVMEGRIDEGRYLSYCSIYDSLEE